MQQFSARKLSRGHHDKRTRTRSFGSTRPISSKETSCLLMGLRPGSGARPPRLPRPSCLLSTEKLQNAIFLLSQTMLEEKRHRLLCFNRFQCGHSLPLSELIPHWPSSTLHIFLALRLTLVKTFDTCSSLSSLSLLLLRRNCLVPSIMSAGSK